MEKNKKASPERLQPTTITIESELIAYLDEMSASIRRQSGQAICRSALIRGFVRGIQNSKMDFTRCRSKADVAMLVQFFITREFPATNQGGSPRPPRPPAVNAPRRA